MQTSYPPEVYELLQNLRNHVRGATAEYMDADELIQAIMENDGLVEWVDYADGQMLEVTTKGLAELGRRDIPSSVEPPEPPDNWADYRDGPAGKLLTTNHCKETYDVDGSELTRDEKAKANRRKNPHGRDGGDYVYRYCDVVRISNRKDDRKTRR